MIFAQRIVMATLFVLLLSVLFPPFHSIHPAGGAQNAGYGFIFSPPLKGTKIDVAVLLTQWVGIILIAVTYALYVFLPDLIKKWNS